MCRSISGYHNFAGEAFLSWPDFLLGLDAEGNGTAPFASLGLASSNVFFSTDSPGFLAEHTACGTPTPMSRMTSKSAHD